jgi:hypothetical protein
MNHGKYVLIMLIDSSVKRTKSLAIQQGMVINIKRWVIALFLRFTRRTVSRRNKCHYTSFDAHNVARNLRRLSFHPMRCLSNVQNAALPILSACYPCFPRAKRPAMSERLQLRLADRLLEGSLERRFISAVG